MVEEIDSRLSLVVEILAINVGDIGGSTANGDCARGVVE